MQQKGFNFIGLSTKTSNQNGEASPAITALWSEFIASNLLEKIPQAIDSDIVCIYTDYESDYTGTYTCLLGMKVSSLDSVPEGLVGRHFEGGLFQTVVAQGELPESLVRKWKEIWDNDAKLNRAYTYDFEIYDERARNGDNSEVHIYLSIKQ